MRTGLVCLLAGILLPIVAPAVESGNGPAARASDAASRPPNPSDTLNGPVWRTDWMKHLFSAGDPNGAFTGLKPICDMTAQDRYKGEDGGLYGGGRNEPPTAHLAKAIAAAKQIQPLDEKGRPSKEGKIGFISIGVSNTTGEYRHLIRYLAEHPLPNKAPEVTLVDCALGMCDARVWGGALALPNRIDPVHPYGTDPWVNLDEQLKAAKVTHEQVQVIWFKNTRAIQGRVGANYDYLAWPVWSDETKGLFIKTIRKLKQVLPNVRLIYLSTRTYAGYATVPLNPEPYAYETGFVMRWLIQQQIAGNTDLSYATTPVLMWGPYFWADGIHGRKIDGLKWVEGDFEKDGTHPMNGEHNLGSFNMAKPVGADKVVQMLTDFLTTDQTAKIWFLKK